MERERIVVSPCSTPEMDLEPVLKAYAGIGYRHFEVFTGWAKSAFDYTRDPAMYLALGERFRIQFHSLHLPPVNDDLETSLAQAVEAAAFARAIGVKIVLFKATSRPNYIRAAKRFLDAVETLGLVPVLQNHKGTAISTLQDFREVLDGINDVRMKALLEVGHFHSVGVHWRDGWRLLNGRIALVHIKDQVGAQSVPFGKGEIDLPGLFRHLDSAGYVGKYVVEMEVADRKNTLSYLAEALRYLESCGGTGKEAVP
jgi:sugar phosphate isomerase/epimerase